VRTNPCPLKPSQPRLSRNSIFKMGSPRHDRDFRDRSKLCLRLKLSTPPPQNKVWVYGFPSWKGWRIYRTLGVSSWKDCIGDGFEDQSSRNLLITIPLVNCDGFRRSRRSYERLNYRLVLNERCH
jgi:hypothetical protein